GGGGGAQQPPGGKPGARGHRDAARGEGAVEEVTVGVASCAAREGSDGCAAHVRASRCPSQPAAIDAPCMAPRSNQGVFESRTSSLSPATSRVASTASSASVTSSACL